MMMQAFMDNLQAWTTRVTLHILIWVAFFMADCHSRQNYAREQLYKIKERKKNIVHGASYNIS